MSTSAQPFDASAHEILERLRARLKHRRWVHSLTAHTIAATMIALLVSAFFVFFLGSWITLSEGTGAIEKKRSEIEKMSQAVQTSLKKTEEDLDQISKTLINTCAENLKEEDVRNLKDVEIRATTISKYHVLLVLFLGGESEEVQELHNISSKNGMFILVASPKPDLVRIKNNESLEACRNIFRQDAQIKYDKLISLRQDSGKMRETLALINEQARLKELGLLTISEKPENLSVFFIQNNITRFGAIVCIILFMALLLPLYKYHINCKSSCEVALDKLLSIESPELFDRVQTADLFNDLSSKLENLNFGIKEFLSLIQKR